jgi:UDP-GlcNAc3NAcA epimerase
MIKVVTVIGARPQFVKAAVLSREFIASGNVKEVIVHTGQHFDQNMSDIFFQEMEIPAPNYQLSINSLGHGAMTGRMLEQIETILLNENPDFVLVFGDTNSTLAAALAAKKLGIKIVHVEAGVRNFDENMPEEINRYLVDRMADINFCCTYLGVENLRKEGFFEPEQHSKIFNYGDVMFDATLFYRERSKAKKPTFIETDKFNNPYILCTIHRASNTDDSVILKEIVDGLNQINQHCRVILPVHPRTKSKLNSLNVRVDFLCIDPVGYFDMIRLIENCKGIVTDSGGLVREAYFFKKPSMYLLKKSPWPELVEEMVCVSVAPVKEKIIEGFGLMQDFQFKNNNYLFGYGDAGQKIVTEIISYYHEVFNNI